MEVGTSNAQVYNKRIMNEQCDVFQAMIIALVFWSLGNKVF